MKTIKYYDLDGTLSKLNNSYDFAYGYYRYKKLRLRHIIVRSAAFCFKRVIFVSFYKRRQWILTAMFCNIKKESLIDYYNKSYKKLFKEQLSTLGRKVIKENNKPHFLLTGCTEIPAHAISDYFGFKNVFCTTFKEKNGRIKGIDIDTFGNHKAKYIKRKKNTTIQYFTDDEKSELEIKKKVDKFMVVEKE